MQFDHRVVVHEIIQALRSHQKAGDNLARMQGLPLTVDNPALDQANHFVREHLAVDAEVVFVAEEFQHGIGDAADSHLQGRTVFDQTRAVLGDPVLPFRDFTHAVLGQRVGDGHHVRQLGDMDEAVAEGAGHAVVDFRDDDPGGFCGGLGDAHLDAEAAEPMGIGRTYMDQRHVERENAAPEKARNFGQEAGSEIRPAFVDGRAHVGADEQRVDADESLHPGGDVVRVSQGEQMGDLDGPGERRGALDECGQQGPGHGTIAGHEDPHAGLDRLHRLLGRGDAGTVELQRRSHRLT